jgi:hypothetical protein
MVFNNPFTTLQKTQRISITEMNWLMLCREVKAVYCENSKKPMNSLSEQNADFPVVKACDTYSYHWTLKG